MLALNLTWYMFIHHNCFSHCSDFGVSCMQNGNEKQMQAMGCLSAQALLTTESYVLVASRRKAWYTCPSGNILLQNTTRLLHVHHASLTRNV
eukprot:3894622-Pleurochrysis_carterae.AAC.2